jgi:hypothetical protein
MSPDSNLLNTEQGRRQAVQFALALTRDTQLAPKPYEEQLLAQFVRGELSIDQVLSHLEEPGAGPDVSLPPNEA